MTRAVSMLDPAKDGADRYLEVGFTGGFVPAEGSTGVMEIAIVRAGGDDTLFTESNDYSDVSKDGLKNAKEFALFYDGDLEWGSQPGNKALTRDLEVRYANLDAANPDDNAIKPGLIMDNVGTQSIPLDQVTARYWFSGTGEVPVGVGFLTFCDSAEIGCGNVTRNVVDVVPPPRPQADKYLEVGFSGGTLYVGSSTGETKLRIQADDNAPLNETNDYSRATNTDYAEWDKVTAYVGPTLVWGDKP